MASTKAMRHRPQFTSPFSCVIVLRELGGKAEAGRRALTPACDRAQPWDGIESGVELDRGELAGIMREETCRGVPAG